MEMQSEAMMAFVIGGLVPVVVGVVLMIAASRLRD